MLCRPFGDLSRVWLCYIGPVVTLAMFGDVMYALWWPLLCLAMLCRPFVDLSHVWLCYYGPLVTLAVFGYVM